MTGQQMKHSSWFITAASANNSFRLIYDFQLGSCFMNFEEKKGERNFRK